jgi:hypothetical protein
MAMNAAALQVAMKAKILAKLTANFSAETSVNTTAAADWDKLADAISWIAVDIVAEVSNATALDPISGPLPIS